MCSQQEPRRGSVVVSISFLHNHNRPSPRLDAIQCSCHQAALNRFAIFACMVFRMMRHLRCQSLLLFHFHLFYTLNALAYHNVGICLWHVSLQTVMYQRISNKPKEPSLWFVSIQTVMYQRISNKPKEPSLWFVACFAANSNVSTHWKHAEGMSLRYDAIFTL